MLKQSLQQKLLQKLSPLQIQVIKLLEIPTAQLEQRIKEELEVNPVLEYAGDSQGSNDEYGDEADSVPEQEMEKDELSIDDYIRDDDIPAYKLQSRNYSRSEEHTSELQSRPHLVCRLLLEKKNESHELAD